MSLSETWLNSSIGDCELDIPNYTFHRFDRDLGSGRRGVGGLLTYFRNKYSFRAIIEWNLCCPDVEWTWSKLTLPHTRPTYICNIYRPPSGNIQSDLYLLKSKIQDIYLAGPGDILLMGDINIDILKSNDPVTKKYLSLIKSLRLHQNVTIPT